MDKNNGLKTTYFALSCQFLLEEIMTWAVQETAKEIIGITYISRLTATPKAISLREFQESTLITYQTAIALNLSHQWNKPVHDVAAHIARHIGLIAHKQSGLGLPSRLHGDEKKEKDIPKEDPFQNKADAIAEQWRLPTFTAAIASTLTVSIHPKGYVQCHLSAVTLDMWLQAMLQVNNGPHPSRVLPRIHHKANVHSPYLEPTPKPQNQRSAPQWDPQWTIPDIPFAIFHAHARCCSLLRLAHTTGQITLQPCLDGDHAGGQRSSSIPSVLRPPWSIIQPKSLPWPMILSPQGFPQQWTIAHPLIVEIITSLDHCVALTSEPSHRVQNRSRKTCGTILLKEITALSTAIHRFDAEVTFHRKAFKMGQEGARTTAASAHTSYVPYLGLIFIAQGLLNHLLTRFLDQANICLDIPDEL